MSMWDDLLPALAERFRVLRYDQRGHGRSPAPPGPYTIAELAGDALALLDRLGVERVSFCGTSLGGMTGMWLAASAPDRIDRLVLCCTSAHLPPRRTWTERAATVRGEGIQAVADAQLERWFTPGLADRRRGARRQARRSRARPSPGRRGAAAGIGTRVVGAFDRRFGISQSVWSMAPRVGQNRAVRTGSALSRPPCRYRLRRRRRRRRRR